MKIPVCDRCGNKDPLYDYFEYGIYAEKDRFATPEMGMLSLDLCSVCEKELYKFLNMKFPGKQ